MKKSKLYTLELITGSSGTIIKYVTAQQMESMNIGTGFYRFFNMVDNGTPEEKKIVVAVYPIGNTIISSIQTI